MQDDVRLSNLEQQYPVVISSKGTIIDFSENDTPCEKEITWERSLSSKGGATRSAKAKEIKDVSVQMQDAIRNNWDKVSIPLVAYYSTDRFKKEKKNIGVEPDGSRLRGYYNALDPLTNIKFFLDLYYTETLSALQHGTSSMVFLQLSYPALLLRKQKDSNLRSRVAARHVSSVLVSSTHPCFRLTMQR